MKQRQILLAALFGVIVSFPIGHAESTEAFNFKKVGLAPSLLPSVRLHSDSTFDLKAHPKPLSQKPPEVPWPLQLVGSVMLHTVEQLTKKQLDEGRPPLPDKNYANYFYPLPQIKQPPPD
jgi:hypothetical protein